MFHSVALSWTASTDQVDGYNLLRGKVAGGESVVVNGTSLVTGTSFTDSGPFDNGLGPYFYTAVSVKGSQTSIHSNETPAVFLPPAAPSNLQVTAVS